MFSKNVRTICMAFMEDLTEAGVGVAIPATGSNQKGMSGSEQGVCQEVTRVCHVMSCQEVIKGVLRNVLTCLGGGQGVCQEVNKGCVRKTYRHPFALGFAGV